jgi:hypothetical protein
MVHMLFPMSILTKIIFEFSQIKHYFQKIKIKIVNQISLWINNLIGSQWTGINNITDSNVSGDASWTSDICWISSLQNM